MQRSCINSHTHYINKKQKTANKQHEIKVLKKQITAAAARMQMQRYLRNKKTYCEFLLTQF